VTRLAKAERQRLAAILEALEDMAAGELDRRAPVSDAHDEIDALAYTVNVLVGELYWTVERLARMERAASQANEQKSVLLRNVSHELRTPLSAILSYTDLLSRTGLDARQRDALERIRANGDALKHLTEDLLDLARIEAGKLQLALDSISPADVASDVVQSLLLQARGKGLALRLSMSAELPSRIATDARRLRQILMNLVGNAIKFTDRGEVTVSLSVEAEGRMLSIDVADTGIGIGEADQQKLFSAFAQSGAARGGVGLGLMLAQQLSRQLGGDLSLVSSSQARGSCFRLRLPTGPSGESRRAPRARTPPGDLSGLTVLLAEDNADVLEAYSMLLESVGCQVETASDGGEAIARATAHVFDVILMDMQMPVVDGREATLRLRQSGYRGPILALSAHAMPEDRQRFIDAGCDDHIAKPIDFEHLMARLAVFRRSDAGGTSG
jgi:signal transduction histidine kinase